MDYARKNRIYSSRLNYNINLTIKDLLYVPQAAYGKRVKHLIDYAQPIHNRNLLRFYKYSDSQRPDVC